MACKLMWMASKTGGMRVAGVNGGESYCWATDGRLSKKRKRGVGGYEMVQTTADREMLLLSTTIMLFDCDDGITRV